MLTIEMLKQNESLKGLSESQLTAITEMSKNDENTVIGSKIGALHGQYDADIFAITGLAKNNGEKSYDYAKRILTEYKTQLGSVDDIKAKLNTATQEVEKLKTELANNSGDEALKQQLKDTKNQVAQLQAQLTSKETEFGKVKENLEKQVKDVHVDYAFKAATSGLKFKAGLSENIQNVLIASAKAEVLAKGTPDFVDNGNGSKTLVFRDADGNVLNNPSNNLNPFTVEELLMQTSLKDAIDEGKKQVGGGTKPNKPGNGGQTELLDLTGAKSQTEADQIIVNYLLANGYTRDSDEFATKSLELRNENNIGALPIR